MAEQLQPGEPPSPTSLRVEADTPVAGEGCFFVRSLAAMRTCLVDIWLASACSCCSCCPGSHISSFTIVAEGGSNINKNAPKDLPEEFDGSENDIAEINSRGRRSIALSIISRASGASTAINVDDKKDERVSMEMSIARSAKVERVANLQDIKKQMKLANRPEIRNIMQLICIVFDTNSALVALLDDEDLFVQDSTALPKGFFPWRKSFCVATLSPATHQTFVCENAKEDIRFSNNELVQAGMVNFYVGAPLVSSAGHRIGTLCFTDSKPRKFDAESCNILNNLAEMVAREIERDWVRIIKEQEARSQYGGSSSTTPSPAEMLRNMETFEEALLLVECSLPTWKLLLTNSTASVKFGVPVPGLSGLPLWEVFSTKARSDSMLAHMTYADHIARGLSFSICNVHIGSEMRDTTSRPELYTLTFRSAGKNGLAVLDTQVGVPAYMPMLGTNRRLYFVAVERQSGESASSMASSAASDSKVPFDDLELGPLLGKGGFGRVYRGWTAGGKLVAVKIIENASSVRMKNGEPLEAAIAKGAAHPGILQVYDTAVIPGQSVWMLLEYCNLGTVQDACDRGWFKDNLSALLSTAREIASAMAFLHKQGVIHGDLSGGNVLLTSSNSSSRRWVAKIADFGMARNLDQASKVQTAKYGRVTHQPPELLRDGILSKAADVWAFGVILWSMFHCSQPWASLNHAQVVIAVTQEERELKWDDDAPHALTALSKACMGRCAGERPTFARVSHALSIIEDALRDNWLGRNVVFHLRVISAVTIKRRELQWDLLTPSSIAALGKACMSANLSHRPTFEHIVCAVPGLQAATALGDSQLPSGPLPTAQLPISCTAAASQSIQEVIQARLERESGMSHGNVYYDDLYPIGRGVYFPFFYDHTHP